MFSALPGTPASYLTAPMTTALTIAVFSMILHAPQGNVDEAAVSPAVEAEVAAETTLASFQSATRLRKLHLVRPDLIPFPLAYDTYC